MSIIPILHLLGPINDRRRDQDRGGGGESGRAAASRTEMRVGDEEGRRQRG
jgi:hypothetical protein